MGAVMGDDTPQSRYYRNFTSVFALLPPLYFEEHKIYTYCTDIKGVPRFTEDDPLLYKDHVVPFLPKNKAVGTGAFYLDLEEFPK